MFRSNRAEEHAFHQMVTTPFDGGVLMPAPTLLYTLVFDWLQAMACPLHRTACRALAAHVTAVLIGQSLRPASRMRALLSAATVPARQRYLRAARALGRPSLSPDRLTPILVRAVLALMGPSRQKETLLAIDSVRCGPWEIFTLGVVWHSRVLPVGWAVLPYPWPKGRFTPTVCSLVRQVAQAWPAGHGVHLVADRGFPSISLFHTLQAVGWSWTVRLQARSWVFVEGRGQFVRNLLVKTGVGTYRRYQGSYGSGRKAVSGHVVVGYPKRRVPRHQRNPGSFRAHELQHERQVRHIATKHPRRPPDASVETYGWMVLFTSLSCHRSALAAYRRRWSVEGSYRDAQGGWDGRHGWDMEPAVARLTTPETVAGLVGLWALSALIQMWVGDQVVHGPVPVRTVTHQWATTSRLSIWARGRLALTDPSGELITWLQMTLNRGAQRIAAAAFGSPTPPGYGALLAA